MSEPKPYETRIDSYYPIHHITTYLPEKIEKVIGIGFEEADIIPANEKIPDGIPRKRIWMKIHGYNEWRELDPNWRENITLYHYSLFHRLNIQSSCQTTNN